MIFCSKMSVFEGYSTVEGYYSYIIREQIKNCCSLEGNQFSYVLETKLLKFQRIDSCSWIECIMRVNFKAIHGTITLSQSFSMHYY